MIKALRTMRGMRDYLKEDKWRLEYVNSVVRDLYYKYNYEEVSTPVIESFELLASKAGSEIREKMYVFEDKGGRTVALRPEMTAPIARLYIENLMRSAPKPVRLGYIGTCYRYDNPQRGRYREFWQAGFELFGSEYPESEAEILEIAYKLMSNLGFPDFKIRVGNIGIIRSFFTALNIKDALQDTILGLLDQKEFGKAEETLKQNSVSGEDIQIFKEFLGVSGSDYDSILEKLGTLLAKYEVCLEELKKFSSLITLISEMEIKDKVAVDMGLARGLEYYTGFIFEIYVKDLNIAVGGGGRYDKLIELFGGEATPALGFAAGLDRLILAMSERNLFKKTPERKILVLPLTYDQRAYGFRVADKIREYGYRTEVDVLRRNIKRALSHSINNNYNFIVFLGEKEMRENRVTIKNIQSGVQRTVSISEIDEALK